ncbi:MAG: hypothetical protein J6C27_02520 [Clostridia bacterium]|nr:hypothetical protein [Clostridia bacterium]
MEMCYNGTLVMPSNYAVVNDNEMEYVEGGYKKWSSGAFRFVKLNGAETDKYLSKFSYRSVIYSALFGFVNTALGIAVSLGCALYNNVISKYNKNDSGVTFVFGNFGSGSRGVLQVSMRSFDVFDNY